MLYILTARPQLDGFPNTIEGQHFQEMELYTYSQTAMVGYDPVQPAPGLLGASSMGGTFYPQSYPHQSYSLPPAVLQPNDSHSYTALASQPDWDPVSSPFVVILPILNLVRSLILTTLGISRPRCTPSTTP